MPPPPPTFREAVRTWVRVGLYSFGGPAGQIAVMHRLIVEERQWVSEERFLHALNYCMLLPGPEAQQLATYLGWLLHRWIGGLVAGVLFVLPGFVAILALSLLYAGFYDALLVQALFFGIKPAVVAIVVEAVLRIGRRALKRGAAVGIAAAAFGAIFLFDVPFPWIIAGAALAGYLLLRNRTGHAATAHDTPPPPSHAAAPAPSAATSPATPPAPSATPSHAESPATPDATSQAASRHAAIGPSWRTTFTVMAIGLVLWWLPIALIIAGTGLDSVWSRIALFFSRAAVVTFGGAYAVLAYVAQQAVETYGWLEPGEMLDGLGMAETTPGPLIQVVQFVGFMGALRDPGPLSPLVAGVLGAVLTTWVTFVPCFIFIFAGAPWVEHLRGRQGLSAALGGITAAVVGVILNLALWFGIHVLFRDVGVLRAGPVRVPWPEFGTVDAAAALITAGTFAALFGLRWGMFRILAGAAAAGLAYHLLR
jgi:chromate transporter